MSTIFTPRYLTEKEVSKITSIAVTTLRNWRHQGRGPVFVKPGGTCVRYPVDELEKFMRYYCTKLEGEPNA